MEAAPSVPAGYQLLTISEGELKQTPGLAFTSRELANYGSKTNVISVMPTADAPAGATIDWSGYVRAGLVYRSVDVEADYDVYNTAGSGEWDHQASAESNDNDDVDVFARGQLRVRASTDTAVGEVGVDIRMRAGYDGISGSGSDVYADVAWGWWAMTPELSFGGGFAGTLGNIGYGFDGSCTCHYIETVGFNPGDTSQMRLTYASGPFSMAVALEDASLNLSERDDGFGGDVTNDRLGVAGELKYSGDMVSGEVSAVWRDIDEDALSPVAEQFIADAWWQVGAGMSFGMGDIASLSLAAAMGEGPVAEFSDNEIAYGNSDEAFVPWNNSWWGVSGLVSFNLSDEVRAEVGAGYLSREFDEINGVDINDNSYDDELSLDSDRWVVGGGLYYDPVDQLTIGVEASYSQLTGDFHLDDAANGLDTSDERLQITRDQITVDLVSVWRF